MTILKNTYSISGEILNIISNAKVELFIISPFVQLDKLDSSEYFPNKFKDAIEYAIQKGVKIQFFTRESKKDDQNGVENIFKTFIEKGCELFFVPTLHSKIYCNESEALITSMNMYLYSIENNDEIGVSLEKKEDVDEVKNYVNSLIPKAQRSINRESLPQSWKRFDAKGYCICCNAEIEFDPTLTNLVCEKCFEINKKYYKGNYCHFCGTYGTKDDPEMPLCKNCYYKFINIRSYYSNNT
jgi:phosphatidylserine/phosphatidylglycerophosphate/cardiolipin synthase-like enzyme